MITYIAGPMSGLPDFNRAAFHKAAAELVERGRVVLNPATLTDGLSEHAYMDIGIAMLRSAEAIYLLDGWEQSAGARAEAALAEKLGLRIYYQTSPRREDGNNFRQVADLYIMGWTDGHEIAYTRDPERAKAWLRGYPNTCVAEYVSLERYQQVFTDQTDCRKPAL